MHGYSGSFRLEVATGKRSMEIRGSEKIGLSLKRQYQKQYTFHVYSTAIIAA